MKKVCFEAPAKTILSGEHAVVYGKPALVAALDLRLKVELFEGEGDKPEGWEKVEEVVENFLLKEGVHFKKKEYGVKISSQIPVGRGLGSSAAFSVASVASLLKFFTKKSFPKEVVNNLAYKVEKHFHGRPSGVDNSTSCFGGLIFFRKEFEFLKVITRLNFKLPKKIEDRLYLVDTGEPAESTREMVELVGRLYNQKPKVVRNLLSEIERTTKLLTVSIVKEDLALFAKAMGKNNELLQKLRVISKSARKKMFFLKDYGVWKITGAGGKKKGSGFALFLDLKGGAEDKMKKKNLSYFKFVLNKEGVQEV